MLGVTISVATIAHRPRRSLGTPAAVLAGALLAALPVQADVPPIPARIGGTVTINGTPLSQAGASGYRFVVTRADGSPLVPAAEGTGLNDYGWYLVDVPIYDATTQPGGAQPGQTARIHVHSGSTELDITSPSSGQFTVGASGSTSQINITATGGGTCTFNLSATSSSFGPVGGAGSFTVLTASYCSWTASSSAAWITITSGSSGTGEGTVHYTVAANTGSMRTGSIAAGGRIHSITQQAPYVPANFTMSNPFPDIGEVVTFSVDSALQVASWDFGQADCRGANPVINCTFLPTGSCNSIQWTYPSAGEKAVTMVLADGRTQTKHPIVRNQGECCQADGLPDASFTISASQIHVGETVTFTDTSSKARESAKALGFNWAPTNPEIGERVAFTLSGVTGDITRATWDFGGTGCAGVSAAQVCTSGLFDNCTAKSFRYASAGTKYVTVTVELAGGGSQSAGPVGVVVQNTGACDGGGDSCSYSLSPSSATFPEAGGSASFAVNTASGCSWTATTSSNWLYISSNSGTGSGTVNYVVTENSSIASRIGYIQVEGRSYRVNQSGQSGGGDTAPTSWFWKVSRRRSDGTFADEATANGRSFTYRFSSPGTYRITLTAGNCAGSDTASATIQVLGAAPEDFVFPAAVSLAGVNDTQWESDFRFFNPCGEPLDVRLEFQPEGTNNTAANLVFGEFQLQTDETRMFASLTDAIPGIFGADLSGSVRVESSSSSGCKVMSVSRTFNDTPYGSLGLFVPALPVRRAENEFLDLTGLIRNANYRTNLRLVNYGDEDTWVNLFVYDHLGNTIGDNRASLVPGHSTRQINDIAGWLGVDGDIAPFSVRADVTDREVQAFATVVDNLTGDSVLFLSSFTGDNRVWVVGAANTEGVNDSQWRTDVWLYNPTESWLEGAVEFVGRNDASDVYGFQWPDLKPHRVREYLDIVGDELSLEETSGYLVFTGTDGGPAPQVAARTYNLDPVAGTYGLNLRAFTEDDLLHPGDTGYIVGVSNSADQNLGFRTNVGLLNTDRDRWTGVRLTLLDPLGAAMGAPRELLMAPGVLRQFDLARYFDVSNAAWFASLKIEVTDGGGVAAYATEIDNRTNDSIFIPAQRRYYGGAAGEGGGGNEAIHPTFSWSPISPEVGQEVVFTISGLAGRAIERAYWDFGLPGCDGSRYLVCTSSYIDCTAASFRYAVSGGQATVALSVEIDGVAYEAQTQILTVKNAGECEASSGEEITVLLPGGVPMELVKIPAGTFMMGSPADEPGRVTNEDLHQVTLTRSFYIGRYEVTQRQWQAVMGTNPSYFDGCGLDCPVEKVSWDDVCGGSTGSTCNPESFVGKVNQLLGTSGFRLPTEAEWERAARAGTQTAFSFVSPSNWDTECGAFPAASARMWWCNNSEGMTHPVGSKEPNGYGLFDMHGNVWEWVADRYSSSLGTEPKTDPTGPTTGSRRVGRGGGWRNFSQSCRSASRDDGIPDSRNYGIGFRLAMSE